MRIIKIISYACLLFFFVFFSRAISHSDLNKKYFQAGVLIDKNRYDKAIILYKEILRESSNLDNHKISRIYNNIGYSYYKLNDLDSALNYYKQALKIDDNYVVCLNNVAVVFLNQKKYTESLTYLSQAYTQNVNNIKVSFNLFVAHANLKNREYAKLYLERAFRIDKDYTIKRLKSNGLTDRQIKKIQNNLNTLLEDTKKVLLLTH